MEKINKLSLEHGKWAILMNDNNFTKKFQSWVKDNGFSGALAKSELPIIKIPLNFIYRAFATKYGLIRAIIGKGRWESKENNFPGLVEMAFKGTKELNITIDTKIKKSTVPALTLFFNKIKDIFFKIIKTIKQMGMYQIVKKNYLIHIHPTNSYYKPSNLTE